MQSADGRPGPDPHHGGAGEIGFNCAVLGLDTVMHAAKAIETVLLDMKSGKFARRNDGMDFEEYKKVVGYDKWESVDERFAPR